MSMTSTVPTPPKQELDLGLAFVIGALIVGAAVLFYSGKPSSVVGPYAPVVKPYEPPKPPDCPGGRCPRHGVRDVQCCTQWEMTK